MFDCPPWPKFAHTESFGRAGAARDATAPRSNQCKATHQHPFALPLSLLLSPAPKTTMSGSAWTGERQGLVFIGVLTLSRLHLSHSRVQTVRLNSRRPWQERRNH